MVSNRWTDIDVLIMLKCHLTERVLAVPLLKHVTLETCMSRKEAKH